MKGVGDGTLINGATVSKDVRQQTSGVMKMPYDQIEQEIGSSRVLVESNAGMYHLSALNSLWRIYRIEDKAIK